MTRLVIAGRRSRCPAFTRGARRGTRVGGIRQTRPTVEEIIAVVRQAGSSPEGLRLRALIVILWRAGLRIGKALDLAETDLDVSRGAVLVRRGKGGRRREVGMDRWAWSQLDPWLALRQELPVGALLCVVRGVTAGRPWDVSSTRKQLGRTAARAGVRRRFAPHQYADLWVMPMRWRAASCGAHFAVMRSA
jgi:site-specific recombinase XerC